MTAALMDAGASHTDRQIRLLELAALKILLKIS